MKKKINVFKSDDEGEYPSRNSSEFCKEAKIKRESIKQAKISILYFV